MESTKLLGCAALALTSAWGEPATPLSFEVASVKLAAPCCAPGQWPSNRPGVDRINFRNVTLWYCITYAYGMRSYQVSGPDWLRQERYDIVANGPAGTHRDQLPQMMQTLLRERFRLQLHHETKNTPGLALVIDKDGPKLKPAGDESGDGKGGARVGMSMSMEGVQRMEISGGTMATLVNMLTGLVGSPVLDRTGLTGRYDLVLEFSRGDSGETRSSGGYNEPPPIPGPPPNAAPGLSIFSSIRQVGLRLEAQKLPLDTIVVDHVEKVPAGN